MQPIPPKAIFVLGLVFCWLISITGWLVSLAASSALCPTWGFGAAFFSFMLIIGSGKKVGELIVASLQLLFVIPIKLIGLTMFLVSTKFLRAPILHSKLAWLFLRNGGKEGLQFLRDAARASELANAGHSENALQICDRLISSDLWRRERKTIKAEIHYVRAVAKQKLKNLEGAIADCQAAQELDPKNTVLPALFGSIYCLAERFSDAKPYLDRAIELNPKDVIAYVNRSAVNSRLGNSEEALKDCQMALQLDPANTTALINAANAHLLLGKFAEAVNDSERALQLDSHCTKAYLNRAIAQMRLGKVSESFKDLDSAIDIDGRSASTYVVRAGLFIESKNPEQALLDCDRALAIDAKSGAAWMNKGTALKVLKRFEDSIQAYEVALETIRSDSELAKCHINFSTVYTSIGDANAAIAQCNAALSIDAGNAMAFNNRAWIKAHLGNFAEAFEDINQSFALRSDNAAAFGTRGLVHFCFNRFDEAKSDLNTALEMSPTCGESWFVRAFIHEKMGEIELANQDYAKAAELEYKLPSFTTLLMNSALYETHKTNQTALVSDSAK